MSLVVMKGIREAGSSRGVLDVRPPSVNRLQTQKGGLFACLKTEKWVLLNFFER